MRNKIYFSGNCYWCSEAVFKRVKGVESVASGMIALNVYGFEGKTEAVRVQYEADKVGLDELLEVFFFSHTASLVSWDKEKCISPLNRSAIFLSTPEQRVEVKACVSRIAGAQTKVFKYIENSFCEVSEKEQNWFEKNTQDGKSNWAFDEVKNEIIKRN
jgi:peptide methionine sulfoxide reductase MsrA